MALAGLELETRQLRLLQRIARLESSLFLDGAAPQPPAPSPAAPTLSVATNTVESHLTNILLSNGVTDFLFGWVPKDYYDRTFEERRDILGAASVDHLCKSIVLVSVLYPRCQYFPFS